MSEAWEYGKTVAKGRALGALNRRGGIVSDRMGGAEASFGKRAEAKQEKGIPSPCSPKFMSNLVDISLPKRILMLPSHRLHVLFLFVLSAKRPSTFGTHRLACSLT